MVNREMLKRMGQAELEQLWDDVLKRRPRDEELLNEIGQWLDIRIGVWDGQFRMMEVLA